MSYVYTLARIERFCLYRATSEGERSNLKSSGGPESSPTSTENVTLALRNNFGLRMQVRFMSVINSHVCWRGLNLRSILANI